MSEVVLGVNAYHGDASAALLVDGVCAAAAEEERFTRVKHQAGFPVKAIRWCVESAGLKPEDITHIAIGRDPTSNALAKASWLLRHPPSPKFLRSRTANALRIMDTREGVARALEVDPSKLSAELHRVEHHRAHVASAFHCSPFDEAAILSFDGMGDFTSTMWGAGRGDHVVIDGAIHHPHSLGHFYSMLTQYMGLPSYGDEYKLMGLAAYGEPTQLGKVRNLLQLGAGMRFRLGLEYFLHHTKGVPMVWEGAPHVEPMYSERMITEFGLPRSVRDRVHRKDADLAASVQSHLEAIGLEMVRRLQKSTGLKRLVLAGGVALNCLLNAKILTDTDFEEVWVQPASNDAGISLGAALWTQHEILGRPRTWRMDHVYHGPDFDEVEHKRALEDAGLDYEWMPVEVLYPTVASRISEGAIVGWFQGRMEFGPRALGNRSIVCDPRSQRMKDTLNARIKKREPFRPFAPSILEERTSDWFTLDHSSPFMTQAYPVRPEKRQLISAVTHEDGTGRLQTVSRATNPRFHALISAFESLTGVPVVLNTSFNENEPICCTPTEAVETFKRTKMDVLVLGNHVAVSASRH